VSQRKKPAPFLIATSCAGLFAAALYGYGTPALAAQNNAQPVVQSGPAIYKLVDASGRVTYTNAPTKGAAKVELDPITVIPSTPAGMLGGGQANTQANTSPASQASASPELIPVGIAPTIAKPEAPTMPLLPIAAPSASPTFTASARAPIVQAIAPIATATVTPVSALPVSRVQAPAVREAEPPTSSAYKLPVVKLSPREAAPADSGVQPGAITPAIAPATAITTAAAPITDTAPPVAIAAMSPRDAEPRTKTIIASPKFEQEEQLLQSLKARLLEEQNASASFRALRARLPATIDQSNPDQAAKQNEIKSQVEQHFERIRSLQDQIAQREQNLAVLRQ
jgi:hypothetical protein